MARPMVVSQRERARRQQPVALVRLVERRVGGRIIVYRRRRNGRRGRALLRVLALGLTARTWRAATLIWRHLWGRSGVSRSVQEVACRAFIAALLCSTAPLHAREDKTGRRRLTVPGDMRSGASAAIGSTVSQCSAGARPDRLAAGTCSRRRGSTAIAAMAVTERLRPWPWTRMACRTRTWKRVCGNMHKTRKCAVAPASSSKEDRIVGDAVCWANRQTAALERGLGCGPGRATRQRWIYSRCTCGCTIAMVLAA